MRRTQGLYSRVYKNHWVQLRNRNRQSEASKGPLYIDPMTSPIVNGPILLQMRYRIQLCYNRTIGFVTYIAVGTRESDNPLCIIAMGGCDIALSHSTMLQWVYMYCSCIIYIQISQSGVWGDRIQLNLRLSHH